MEKVSLYGKPKLGGVVEWKCCIYMVTDRIDDGENLSTRLENPSLSISFNDESNDEELDEAKETCIGSERETSRVLLDYRCLQHKPTRPGQAVSYEIEAP